jgi:chorismate mutase
MDAHEQLAPASRTIAALIQRRLEAVRESISRELCAIPTPIAGCDANCNQLLEDRSKVVDELQRFMRLTRQAPAVSALVEFAQASAWIDQVTRERITQLT